MRYPKSYSVSEVHTNHIDGLVRQIVDARLPAARRRISSEAKTMSASELRGYLRARAFVAVRDQALRLAAAKHFESSVTEQLIERALERTVNLLFRELTEQPPLILPMYEAPRRAAA